MARTATVKTTPTTMDTATEAATTEVTTPTTAPAPPAVALAELREIAVADITTDGSNPRTLFDLDGEAGIRELAASITAHGLVQPITVRAHLDAGEDTPPYLLVAGERRLRAIRDVLKRGAIAAIIRHDLTDDTAGEATVLENLQRRDLHPIEEARGLTRLRAGHSYSVDKLAARLGRSKGYIKDRLKLCDLPATAQDLYLRDTGGRLTLTKMLAMHEYTHGGKDNTGFPALIAAITEDVASGKAHEPTLANTAFHHPSLVQRFSHDRQDTNGRWGGNFFDTHAVCRACPFAAYRRVGAGDYEYEGFCLMPDHYATLKAKGQARYDEAERTRQREINATPAAFTAQLTQTLTAYNDHKTAAQKGKEIRTRRLAQKAEYMPNVLAVRRSVDLIANVEAHDLGTLAAYSLVATVGLSKEDWGEIARRHGVDAGALMRAGGATRPSADHIKALRTLDPLGLIKATIEALLIRQAQAARDYEPDNDHSAGPDPVFKLYTGDQTNVTASAAPTPPTFTHVGVVDGLAVEPTTGDDDNAEEDPDQNADIEDDATEGERIPEDDGKDAVPSLGTGGVA
jgi:ParB/RepB/Spo0J family partition protein